MSLMEWFTKDSQKAKREVETEQALIIARMMLRRETERFEELAKESQDQNVSPNEQQ